ncbi:MAG: hypothetical protein HOP19_17530, partial [Acidobacteria bacterium]|nr:hypothetical protein [Acidobacteriota bacterium]
FAAAGGTGVIEITANSGCAWTAASNATWITINSGGSGIGIGAVAYTVAANPTTLARTGTLTVAERTVTITQEALTCTYELMPTSQSFDATGGTGNVEMKTNAATCSWAATSNADWLTITSGGSGSGNGTIRYSVSANNSPNSRRATITGGGQIFSVTQAGITCTYQLSKTSENVPNSGGVVEVNVTSQTSCTWTATSQAIWITITSGATGTGNGPVAFTASPNITTAQRQGTLTIAGQTFTVTQSAPNALSSVSAASYLAAIAPDSIAVIFGTNLATRAEPAGTNPLPTTLAGTSVRIRDSAGTERLASLFFVSATQINYLIPAGLAEGAASVLVTSGDGTLSLGTITLTNVAPGLFAANANGSGIAAGLVLRVKADGSQVYENLAQFDAAQGRFVPLPIDLSNATEQVFLLLFGTGFRNTARLSDVTVQIGGASAEALYAGRQGDLVGLDQLNVRLNRNLMGRGELDVLFSIAGRSANPVRISVK